MFLHIGDDLVLREQDIIGIFDFETSTLSKHTKKYLQSVAEADVQMKNWKRPFVR